jgi:hypothetical protein
MFPVPMIKALQSLIFRGPIADGDLALLAFMVINRLPFTDMLSSIEHNFDYLVKQLCHEYG